MVTHQEIVTLLSEAGRAGEVNIGVRRKVPRSGIKNDFFLSKGHVPLFFAAQNSNVPEAARMGFKSWTKCNDRPSFPSPRRAKSCLRDAQMAGLGLFFSLASTIRDAQYVRLVGIRIVEFL